jgi:putative selenium metabolism hydrolase
MNLSLTFQDEKNLTTFVQDLVRTPSLSGHEDAVAKRLAAEMERVDFDEVSTDHIGNVIGRVGSGAGPVLLYNGHMDTVQVGDARTWKRDPFEGVIEKGVLYGLGASDMKGGLAAMVYGVQALKDAGVSLAGDLYVVGVVQEEPCEGVAMRVLVEEEGLRPDFVVLGEPTGMQIRRGHRGRIGLRVTARGRSCHAATPEQGENAIYTAARIIFGLELLSTQLANDPVLGRGTLAVTNIENTAGSLNAIPDSCTFFIDRRLTLGETEAIALAEVRNVILREGVEASVEVSTYTATSYTGYPCHCREYYPAWVIDEDHPLLVATSRAVRETLGYRPRVGQWAFSTDGTYTMGVAGIPTIGFGPGQERHAHTVEDQVRLADVCDAARVYARLAVEMLGTQ